MYGKSVQCDMCGRIELIDTWSNSTVFDSGFNGWIRLSVNKPRDYEWVWRDPKYATAVGTADCCSISCARRYLSDVHDTVPVDEPES